MEHIYVGFWKETTDIGWYPGKKIWTVFPVANSATSDQNTLLSKLIRIEGLAKKESFLGHSCCRICGAHNGAEEYSYNGIVWPSGYKHYLRDHAVACDPQMEAMISAVKLTP